MHLLSLQHHTENAVCCLWRSLGNPSSQSTAFLKSEVWCLDCLSQPAQKYDVFKPTCPFPYCLPLGFLCLESDTSSLTWLLDFFSKPVHQCDFWTSSGAQCVTLRDLKGEYIYVHTDDCKRIDLFFILVSVYLYSAVVFGGLFVFFSSNILHLMCQDKRDAQVGQAPLLLSALLSSSLLPSAHLMFVGLYKIR